MIKTIPFPWISKEAGVRCLWHEDKQIYLSIRDLISVLCTRLGGDALKVWYRLEKTSGEAFKGIVGYYQFPGMGQRGQPVILGSKACVLISEIPVSQPGWADKAVKAIEASLSTCLSLVPAPPMEDVGSSYKKRKMEEIELEERLLAIEEKRVTMQLEAQAAPLEFLRTCNEIAQSMGGWDAGQKAKTRAMLSNLMEMVYKSQPGAKELIAEPAGEEPRDCTSVSKVVTKMGLRNKVSYLRVGQVASKLFLEKHGVRPGDKYGKHVHLVDGRPTSVNDYGQEDEALIMQAVDMVMQEAHDKQAD